MGFSREASIITLLVIDTLFFFLEIIVGYAVHSLALVADSFHMLNDIISLVIAYWAIKKAGQTENIAAKYTYGWQRAEILGALVNGVFLMALCVSIFLEAIQRFVEPQIITSPLLIVGVGSAGLASNIIGLFLFHEHGHGHSHGHGPAGSDSEEDIESFLPEVQVRKASLAAHGHSHRGSHTHSHDHAHAHGSDGHKRRQSMTSEDIFVHPAQNRAHIKDLADGRRLSETSPLLTDHSGHHHAKPKDSASGGHSHENMNMRAVFLHVLGDALGNIGVIATGLFVQYTKFSWRFYADPVISLVITGIILASAVPLCKSASLILLQVAPPGIHVDEIREDIESIQSVISAHELHVWQLSDTKLVASVHVRITSSDGYMQVAQDIKKCLHAFGIHSCTIQPEFVHDGLAVVDEMEASCLLDCDPDCPPNGAPADAHGHGHAH
ncbi:cation efflux protein [Protomyces lactucae-debilis]|uniref:Cation efflux protein n=1 Tax=Protomyces lactucae-debilis TaxID=2754530 RepID=A0A1Y2F9V8_PROLT|nr:cation efflux protein [Protomyces lactucae-debilis]ORY80417.1 cation efflux protein [Protomyces lactucae-debilis]